MTPDDSLPAHLPTHSVPQRLLITLFAQVSKSALSFLTGLVVARGLGPTEYGNLAFLLGSFAGLRLLLDMSTSSAFFTLTAQRPRSAKFYAYYLAWVGLFEIGLPLLLIALLLPQQVIAVLWQSQSRNHVWLALLASALQYLIWPQIIQLGEVVRRTHISQTLTIWISASQFILVMVLHFTGWLTLTVFLVSTASTFLLVTILAFVFLPRPWDRRVASEPLPSVVGEFYHFCSPLALSYTFQAAQSWIEVWLLQHYAGAQQQGYYALGIQLSLIGLVATSSMQNIFWREVAELEARHEDARVRQTYLQTSYILLVTAAAPVAFLLLWTPQVVDFALGARYHDAIPAVAILFLYPITQCLTTPVFVLYYVMRKTRTMATVQGVTALLNIAFSFVVLLPAFGVNGGAMGMAVRIVLLAMANFLILETLVCRERKWALDWPRRLRLLGVLMVISILARAAGLVVALKAPVLVALIASGMSFVVLTGLTFYRFPDFAGISAQMRDHYLERARRVLTGSRA